MPLVSQTYAGAFLNASELTPLGQRRTALVHAATSEVIGQENKPAIVLDLVTASGKAWPKRVVLNKGNALQMVAAYGDDTDHWIGQRITIWAENVMFQGRLVPGIKVQAASPAVAPAAALSSGAATEPEKPWASLTNDLDDEIPFA
jgi:hypothetical protein